MNNTNVTINEMISLMIAEFQRVGYNQSTIWCEYHRRLRSFAVYCKEHDITFFSLDATQDYILYLKGRVDRHEITQNNFCGAHFVIKRVNEFYLTGELRAISIPKGTKYVISPDNERLIDLFIAYKNYGSNTRDDVEWVVRKYLCYFESKGHTSMSDVTIDEVRGFIFDAAASMRFSSLYNVFLYLKYFHIFMKETNIDAPDCVELFSNRINREMPIQAHVTDDELDKILAVIDTTTECGKRDRAIILLAATIGLRACDIARLTLTDVDWRKGEIQIVQQKTGRTVYLPLIKEAGEALSDYILNARPNMEVPQIFLRSFGTRTPIADPSSIGFMFRSYERKAGIPVKAFDGKGFHGLRRRLAKKLLVTGTPLTTIAQILGHDDLSSVRQYLSLNVDNLKECALDFQGIPLESEATL